MGEFGFAPRRVENGLVAAGGVEAVAAVLGGAGRARRGLFQRVGRQPAEEEADVGDVGPGPAAGDGADVGAVVGRVEGAARQVAELGLAQVRRAEVRGPHVVEVLGGGQTREEFHRRRRPAGGVPRQLLQHGDGALAPSVAQGVGHPRPQAEAFDGGQRADAQKVGQVGHGPGLAGLDEAVVVEAGNLVVHHLGFAGEDGEERLKGTAGLGIAEAQDAGEEGGELGGGVARFHGGLRWRIGR